MGGGVSVNPEAPGVSGAALGDVRSPGDVAVRTASPRALAVFPLARTAVAMIPFRP